MITWKKIIKALKTQRSSSKEIKIKTIPYPITYLLGITLEKHINPDYLDEQIEGHVLAEMGGGLYSVGFYTKIFCEYHKEHFVDFEKFAEELFELGYDVHLTWNDKDIVIAYNFDLPFLREGD